MYDIITIGTITRDVFLQSEKFKALEDEYFKKHGIETGRAQCFQMGAKIHIDAPVFAVGGGAANSAITFARQQLNAAALVKTGNDEAGTAALGALRNEGITPLALYDQERMTGYSTLLLSPEGDRTVLTHRGAANEIEETELPMEQMKASWAYIAPGRIPFAVIERVVNHFSDAGSNIAMDPSGYYLEMGKEKLKPLLAKLAVVKMNREEAAILTEQSYDDEDAIFNELDDLVPGIAVMTEGPDGVVVSDGERRYRAGVFQEKRVADRTGAGDAFGSGFVSALARSQNHAETRGKSATRNNAEKTRSKFSEEAICEAIRLGSANATSVVEYIGAQRGALTKEEAKKRRWKNLDITVTSPNTE